MSTDGNNSELNDFDRGYFGGNNFPNSHFDPPNAKNDFDSNLWSQYDGNQFGNNWESVNVEPPSRQMDGPKFKQPNFNNNGRDPWLASYDGPPPSKPPSDQEMNYPYQQRNSRHSNGPNPNFQNSNRNYDHHHHPPQHNSSNGRYPSVPANPVSYKKPAFVPGQGPTNGPGGPHFHGPGPGRGHPKSNQGKYFPPQNNMMSNEPMSHHNHATSPSSFGSNNSPYPNDRPSHGDRNTLPLAPTMQPPPQMTQMNANSLSIFEVQFKCHTHFYMLAPAPNQAPANIGDFVIVEADRGEDLGIITEVLTKEALIERRMTTSKINPLAMRGETSSVIGKIKRVANAQDELLLPQKAMDEEQILQTVRELAHSKYRLPLTLHDAVYQFDRQKLTFFYSSEVRIDFREIVRELFTKYHTRIWMHEIPYESVPLIKFDNWASISLATGMKFAS